MPGEPGHARGHLLPATSGPWAALGVLGPSQNRGLGFHAERRVGSVSMRTPPLQSASRVQGTPRASARQGPHDPPEPVHLGPRSPRPAWMWGCCPASRVQDAARLSERPVLAAGPAFPTPGALSPAHLSAPFRTSRRVPEKTLEGRGRWRIVRADSVSVSKMQPVSVFLSGSPQLTPFFISFLFSNHIFSPSQLQTLLEPRPSLLQERVLEPPWGAGWGVSSAPAVLGAPVAPFAWRMFLEEEQFRGHWGPGGSQSLRTPEGEGGGPGWCQGRQRAGRACP